MKFLTATQSTITYNNFIIIVQYVNNKENKLKYVLILLHINGQINRYKVISLIHYPSSTVTSPKLPF